MKNKKILIPIEINNINKRIKGYLYPCIEDYKMNSFFNSKDNKLWKYGMVIIVGNEIRSNDLFKNIVDEGRVIKSVSGTIQSLDDYINQLKLFKIGDVVQISFKNEKEFKLVKLKKKIKRVSAPIP